MCIKFRPLFYYKQHPTFQGPSYLVKMFGPKARNNMTQLGGVDEVARAITGKFQFIRF